MIRPHYWFYTQDRDWFHVSQLYLNLTLQMTWHAAYFWSATLSPQPVCWSSHLTRLERLLVRDLLSWDVKCLARRLIKWVPRMMGGGSLGTSQLHSCTLSSPGNNLKIFLPQLYVYRPRRKKWIIQGERCGYAALSLRSPVPLTRRIICNCAIASY